MLWPELIVSLSSKLGRLGVMPSKRLVVFEATHAKNSHKSKRRCRVLDRVDVDLDELFILPSICLFKRPYIYSF